MFLTPRELLDIVVMTLGVGFIFMDLFSSGLNLHAKPVPVPRPKKFDWHAFGFACLVTAPAVIFHELAHKFTAIGFGADATFHAAYLFLALGIALKLIRSPIIFFVPGYVAIPGTLGAYPTALTAFAGPALNGLLYLLAIFVIENVRMNPRARMFWLLTRRINGFLFIFNLLPIPGFDGFTVFSSLFHLF
ncbi:MAG TPA: hypothetical protein VLJ21_00595 [Candidatus Binatia bacterium]|nr:hypothetical protein [Candidatus Binatia bacterium]